MRKQQNILNIGATGDLSVVNFKAPELVDRGVHKQARTSGYPNRNWGIALIKLIEGFMK